MKNQKISFAGSIPKRPRTCLFRLVAVLAVVALMMQVCLPRAQAYDLSSLNGSYAGSFSGLTPIGPPPPHGVLRPISGMAPEYAAGLWTFDGAGGFTALLVFNFGGGLIFGDNWDLNLTGTYTVNANGTGTMSLPAGHRLHFVIGAGGGTNVLKLVSASEVTAGSMVKQ